MHVCVCVCLCVCVRCNFTVADTWPPESVNYCFVMRPYLEGVSFCEWGGNTCYDWTNTKRYSLYLLLGENKICVLSSAPAATQISHTYMCTFPLTFKVHHWQTSTQLSVNVLSSTIISLCHSCITVTRLGVHSHLIQARKGETTDVTHVIVWLV